MTNEKKPDVFKADLVLLGIFAGAMGIGWFFGKRSGVSKGYVIGTMNAYETVFKALSA